nr:PEPxxWA-CTERM sorting domain-containing protein [uncultured Sphingomonas sp.]
MRIEVKLLAFAVASLQAISPGSAQVVAPTSRVDADCSPALLYTSQVGQSASCSANGAEAMATTSFSALKASVSTSDAAVSGSYYAYANFTDNMRIEDVPTDLVGTAGTIAFTLAIDGSILSASPARLNLGSSTITYRPATATSAASYLNENALWYSTLDYRLEDGTTGIINANSSNNNVFNLTNNFGQSAFYVGNITFVHNIVFGSNLNYSMGMLAEVRGPSSYVDFFNTATITRVTAYDALGSIVPLSFSNASGVQLPSASGAVPEPGTWTMMLLGFGATGASIRRRRLTRVFAKVA